MPGTLSVEHFSMHARWSTVVKYVYVIKKKHECIFVNECKQYHDTVYMYIHITLSKDKR